MAKVCLLILGRRILYPNWWCRCGGPLDLNMPRMDGFEVLKQLRKDPNLTNLPVVVLSTSSESRDQQRALTLGANQFYTKSATYTGLVSLIKTIAAEWRLQ